MVNSVRSSSFSRLRSEWGALQGTSRSLAVALSTFVVVGLVAILTVVANPRSEPRTIEISVRDMTYYVAGLAEANPEIRLAAGEEVRIVLRNQEPGMTHDFTVPLLGVKTDAIRGEGTAFVTVRAPGKPGRYEYLCTPHARMMRGLLVVE